MNHIRNFTDFLNEDTPNQNTEEPINTKWDKMETEERVNLLLAYVKDPDEAEKYAQLTWSALPEPVSANLATSSTEE